MQWDDDGIDDRSWRGSRFPWNNEDYEDFFGKPFWGIISKGKLLARDNGGPQDPLKSSIFNKYSHKSLLETWAPLFQSSPLTSLSAHREIVRTVAPSADNR